MRRLMILSVLSVPALLISATALGGDVVAKLEVWDPKTGNHAATALYDGAVCPVAVKFRGRLAASAAGTVRYQFVRSDGAAGPVQAWDLPAAGHKEVETTWTLGKDYSGWVALKVLSPQETQSEKAEFKVVCGAAARPLEPAAQPPLRPIPKEGERPREHPVGQAIPKEGTQARPAGHEALPIGELVPLEENTDRPGLDYKDFDLTESRPELCRNACLQEPRCRAFTYGRPGLFGNPKAHCWLKTGVPAAVSDPCCTSGVMKEGMPGPAAADPDEDGIPDALERSLLDRFSPYYLFSSKDGKDENYHPADPVRLLADADVRAGDWREGAIPRPSVVDSCHLREPANLLICVSPPGTTDLLRHPAKTDYYLNLSDDLRGGEPWPLVTSRGNVGTYGHVVPASGGLCSDDYPGQVLGSTVASLYKIEYWQLFSYSGQDPHGYDHEGDWSTVQLWYDPAPDGLSFACHFAHGKGMCFDLRLPHQTVDIGGGLTELRGPSYGRTCKLEWVAGAARYPDDCQNNHLRFRDRTHVAVYFERDAHEAWPSPAGSMVGANEHNGRGAAYLTRNVPNLGEVRFNPDGTLPSAQDPLQIVLRFNGRWGAWHHALNSPPPGPTLHCEWTWPANAPAGLRSGACGSCEF